MLTFPKTYVSYCTVVMAFWLCVEHRVTKKKKIYIKLFCHIWPRRVADMEITIMSFRVMYLLATPFFGSHQILIYNEYTENGFFRCQLRCTRWLKSAFLVHGIYIETVRLHYRQAYQLANIYTRMPSWCGVHE